MVVLLMNIIKEYKNILVFNPAFLGDSLITTPLIKGLKYLFPNAKISFSVRPENADLFRNLDFIDEVIVFDKRNTQKGFSGLLKFSKSLSYNNFDLILDLHLSIRSSSIFALVKNTTVIGFSSAVMSFIFTHRVEKKIEFCEVERYLHLLSPLVTDFSLDEAKKISGNLECYVDPVVFDNTKEYFKTVTPYNKIIGIAPGSVWNTKRFPATAFAYIAKKLYNFGYAIALFGGPGDKESTDEFKDHFKFPFYDFSGKTSLKELPAIIANLNILIVNDSGLMHIATATNIPNVAIFGPTTKELGFFPYDSKSIVIENNNLSCRPCGKHGGNSCPKKHFKCMLDIKNQDVIDAVLNILQD